MYTRHCVLSCQSYPFQLLLLSAVFLTCPSPSQANWRKRHFGAGPAHSPRPYPPDHTHHRAKKPFYFKSILGLNPVSPEQFTNVNNE